MITDNQKELLIQLYYDRGVLKKEIRSYEVSLWTLLDEFITVLKWSDVEQKGRIESPKMTLNIDGTEKFTFSIPMYYRENGKLVENPNWYNVLNDKNLMVGMRKLKVIFNKDNPEIDNVDWRNLYDKIYVPADYNGNVNLFNRPIVPASKFIEAGWDGFEDAGPAAYGTLYSSSDSCIIEGKEYDVIYTPVSMNGSVTAPAALATYISSVISSGSTVLDKLDYDASHSKLLLGIYEVNSDNHNQWAEELHEMQAEWDIIRAKNEWFGYNSNPYNIEFGESSYYYYYQKYLRSINTFEFIITNVTETHEKDILTCEIESEGLAFLELGKIGYKISLSLANFELVYKEWETDGEWTRYDGTKVTTQPIQNVQYWCEEAGLEPIPSDPALINSRVWYYDIQMNWDAFADGKQRNPHVVYEESYTSSWDSNLRPLAFENFREKARSIEIENSNLYNITKTIAEKFEIFCKYEYMYDENYHIIGRKVIFYNNFMQDGLGSITLQYPYSSSKISRTMDSTAITTKLFVLDVDEHGIADAEPNASREDYILNFDFLYQTGAITQELYDAILPYYKDVRAKNDELINLLNQLIIYLELQPEIAAKKTVLKNSKGINKEQIEANSRLSTELGVIELTAANPDYLLIHTGENGSRYVNLSTTNKGIMDDSITVWATFGYDKDNKPLLSNLITGFTLDHDGANNLTTLTFTQDTSAYTNVYLLYKYDPKLYYDNVIEIWKTKAAQDELDLQKLTTLLDNINKAIDDTTSKIEGVLREKEQIVKAFERLMGPALREGYWQPEDYDDYGDRKISNISLSASVDLTLPTGKEMKAGWDSELFTGELKLYYLEGVNEDKIYYPCINLKTLFNSNIPTDLSDYSIVWKATNKENYSYDWTSIKDLKVLSIGSSALIRFINYGNEGIIPVLVVTGAQAFTDKELERLTLTGEARLEKYSVNVDKISGATSVSHGDNLISINNNWIIIDNTNETNYSIVLPRIKNSAMTLKTDTNSLFIKYGNNTLSQFSDYYINTRIGKGSGGPEYYITIKPEVLIKYGLNQNFNINYILSNANTAIYLDARKVSLENAYPKVSYSIDVNLLNTSLLHTLYSKLARIVMVNDTDLKFENTFGYISLVDLDLDNCQNDTVEIKNYKTKFEDLFSTIVAQTEEMKRSGAGLTTALSGGIPLSEDGFVQTIVLHKDILDAYLDSHFDSSLVVRDRLTELFGEAGDILGGANKTLNKLKSLTIDNAGILSRFAENVAIELTTKIYRSTEKPASFKPGDIWIYTDEYGNEYRYLAMADSSSSGSGSDFGFVRTHDGSLASIRGANVVWDAEAGTVDITGENEINIRSGKNLYLAANADVNIVGNKSVNIGGSTINIGAGIGPAHFTVSGQINATKFTNKTNNELGSFWFRYKDGHWTYKNNSVNLADYGITIAVKENQSLVDDVDQLFVWNNGNNNITYMESNNNTMGSINLVASGITLIEEGKANTELAKVLISPYRIEMGAAELEMKAKSKIILRSSTGTYAKTAAISISAEEGVYIGAGQGVRIYSGSPTAQVYVGPAHYSKYQKGDIWVKIKKIGNWAGHIGYDGDAGGTNFYTTSILSGQEHNTFEVEGIYDALDNWNAVPDTPEPATDYRYTTDGWQKRSTSNAELSARSVIAGTGASVELNKEHLLLGFANIEKNQGSAIELTDEFVIIASGKNISGNLTTDKNTNITGLSSGLIGAKFTNSSIGFATQSGSIINAFIMNDKGLTMGSLNTGNAIDLVSSSKNQLRSHFSSTDNGSYVRIAPEGIELGSLGDIYINTDNFKLLTHSRSAGDYPNGEYINGNTILALGSGFNSGSNPVTGRESISALRTKVENGELDIKLIVNLNGAYFKGNVYADNGVFNGTVYASAGSFTGNVKATSLTIEGNAEQNQELLNLLNGNIQQLIDDEIQTWNGKGTPAPFGKRTNNMPNGENWSNEYTITDLQESTHVNYSAWIEFTNNTATSEIKKAHVGDLYYDIGTESESKTAGSMYRWVNNNGDYYWMSVGDTVSTKALELIETGRQNIENIFTLGKPLGNYFDDDLIYGVNLNTRNGLLIMGNESLNGTIGIFRANHTTMGFFNMAADDVSKSFRKDENDGLIIYDESAFKRDAELLLYYQDGSMYVSGTLFADKIVVREKENNEEVDKNWRNYLGSRDLSYMIGVKEDIKEIMNEAGEILSAAAKSLSDVNALNDNNRDILKSFYKDVAKNMTPNTSKGPYHEWYFKTGDIWEQTASDGTKTNLDSNGELIVDNNPYASVAVIATYIAMHNWDEIYNSQEAAQTGKAETKGWNRTSDGRLADIKGAAIDIDTESGNLVIKAQKSLSLLCNGKIDISGHDVEIFGDKSLKLTGGASVDIASGGSISLVTSSTNAAYTGTNAIVMDGAGIMVAAAAKVDIKSAEGIKIWTSDTNSTAAIKINRTEGVWIGANKSVTLHSGTDGEGEVAGSNFSMTPSRILMGVTSVTDTITNTTAIDITSELIMLAAGTTGGAGANFATYTDDNITDTTTLAGVQIKSNYIGLATGRGDNTSLYRSLISITPTRILIGVGKKNTINVTETTVSTSSNFEGSNPAITGGYIKIDSSGSKPLFEIGSTGIFKLLTPSVYINGAATGTEDMFALANSDGTQYALKFTANGNLSIKGTVHASAGWFGANDGWIIGGDIQTNNVTPIIDELSLANTGSRIQSYNNKVILNAGTANTEPYIIMRKDSTDSNGNAILEDVFEYYNGTLAIKGTVHATSFYIDNNEITTTDGKIDANCINVDENSFSFNGIGSTEWNGTKYQVALLSKTSMLIGANGTNSGGIIIARDSSSVAAEINKERICLLFPNKVEITNTNTKGEWEKVGDEWKFKVDGNYKISSWIEYNSHWYYVDADGNMLHDLTTLISGKYYYFDSTGIACDSSILLTDTGLDITGNRLRMNGLEAWGRDDIIVMKRSGETLSQIETRMNGKHDWVLIKPYYDARIEYLLPQDPIFLSSEELYYTCFLKDNTLLSFGSNATWYLYSFSCRGWSGSMSNGSVSQALVVTLVASDGTTTRQVELSNNRDPNKESGYAEGTPYIWTGALNKLGESGVSISGDTEHISTNLCQEGWRLSLYISFIRREGGYAPKLQDITVTCTCDATTSRVPCTVYYYP